MPSSTSAAFTLLEIITALAIMLVLAALVTQIATHGNRAASIARAKGEIARVITACESYKADNGRVPTDFVAGGASMGVTDQLKPKEDFIPTRPEYQNANLFLYKELTGDKQGLGSNPDGTPDPDEPKYLKELDSRMLKVTRDPNGQITEVKGIQDPWGYLYGYSTAAAREEMLFQMELQKNNVSAIRLPSDAMPGFNAAGFDLWSTGGSRPSSQPSDKTERELEWAKWIKNW